MHTDVKFSHILWTNIHLGQDNDQHQGLWFIEHTGRDMGAEEVQSQPFIVH